MTYELSEEETKLLNESLKQLEFKAIMEFVQKYCNSSLGKEIILKSAPTDDVEWLVKEHGLIEENINLIFGQEQLPIDGITDVKTLLHKALIQNAVLSSTDILSVCDSIRISRLIKSFLKIRQESYPLLYEESAELHENRLLEKHIEDAIDESGEVRDNASTELSRIRREIHEKSARLRSRVQKILKRVSEDDMLQEDFVSVREGRFVLPVKVENKRQIPGIIHGVSQSGATVFLEPSEIIEMNNDLSLLINEEKREVYRILSNLTGEIGSDAQLFLHSIDIIAHFDSLIGKARYALEFGGIKPIIHEINEIYLGNIRHPLLIHSKGAKKVMPLNIEFTDSVRGHLISGPNAGGKTVALKSIGLNLAMALSGIYPLGECRTNYRMLFSSIGDHQSIENDLSTFSSQILQLRQILSYSDRSSLVLIDEIGSGTDPQEGAALSAGILDTLIEMKSFFVVTTHQSSLKSYALNRAEINNDSLEFSEQQLQPTYKFMAGIPGNSYAFILAKNLGLQSNVIERAKKYLGSRQTELEESISTLQKFKAQAEELKIQAEQQKLEAEKARKNYEQKFSEIKEKRQIIIDEARKEAYEVIRNANALVENTIREIKEEKRSLADIKSDYQKEKSIIEKQAKKIFQKTAAEKSPEALSVGDYVTMMDSTTVGTILAIDDDNNTALVEFNELKFRTDLSELFKTDTIAKTKPKRSTTDNIKFDAKASIDIRGMRAAEALREVDDFISNAIMGNIELLTIIHGKGTGALRHAIHEYLSSHPSVKSYHIGELVEGGDGVTFLNI